MQGSSTQPVLQTRDRLIAAALHLFGRDGFAATSIRAVADRAETNVASIAYHFGSKDGLRLECARAVAGRLSDVLGDPETLAVPADPAMAAEMLDRVARGFVQLVLGAPGSQDMVAFMLRQVTDPGGIADEIYGEVIAPRHRRFCALWAAATGQDPEDEAVKLAVFAAVGQIVYFRIAQPLVERRMGWTGTGPDETGKIAETISLNLAAALERHRR